MTENRPESVERINFGLVQEASDALSSEASASGLKPVDIVNRAVQLYHTVAFEWRQGNELVVRDPETKKTFLLHLTEEAPAADAPAPTISAKLVSTLGSNYDLYFDGSEKNGPNVELGTVEEGVRIAGSLEAVSETIACIGHAVAEHSAYGDSLTALIDGFAGARLIIDEDDNVEVHFPEFRLP